MLLGVIRPRHNDLCCRVAVHSIVHFVLHCGEEISCGLAVERIIHRSGIDIRDLLIEPPFTGTNLLNFGNQMVKIILVKNLPIDESVLIQNIALPGEGGQHLGGPLTELCCPARVDPIANSDDRRQGVELIAIGLSVIRNLCKICTSCRFGQFAALIDIFQVLCDNTSVYFKKLSNGFLGQPNILVLHPYFNSIFVGIPGKHKKIHRAVADLKRIFFAIRHVPSPQGMIFSPSLPSAGTGWRCAAHQTPP